MTQKSSRLRFGWSLFAGAAALAVACLSLVVQARAAGQPPAGTRTTTPAAARPAGTPQSGAATPATPRAGGAARAASRVDPRPIRVLFLGQDEVQPHNPVKMFPLLAAPLARRGIQLTYASTPAEALVPAKLAYYDALMIYGNHTAITPEQEKALVDFVEGGRGLVALHSASAEFTGSEKYVSLVGGAFLSHGTGEFTAEIVAPAHPIMQGIQPFMTWDETYVHTKHNPAGRTVLMERVDAQGREPWTWVRAQGKGRVFYTAYGHDERTWTNPGFQMLVEHALAWTVDPAVQSNWLEFAMPAVTYLDGFNVPNYENRDPAPKYQLPFTADEAQKFMQTPGEFEVKLFAAEPDVIKPMTMAFDERGRLWVVEANDYPNEMFDGKPGDDRIKILEDTNGDGRADKFTVFAEHLNIPTSLVFANGGVIVGGAPNFLFLKDTNGDGKADVRQVLSTGWGTRDTHAGPSNLQYAPDNHIWGVVGYSGFSGTMNGKQMQFTQGPYRFKPDGSEFEYLTTSTNNTWGLGFSETFDVLGSTANNDQSWYMAIPSRYFENVDGIPGVTAGRIGGAGYQSVASFYSVHPTTPYIRQVDVQGGYTAAAGHYLYTARSFPKEYWNRIAFINEPTAHIVGQAVVENQGAGFVTRDGWNMVSSAEEWFAPVASMVGPDGALWVADWYNFIAQHNPTPVGYSVGKGAAYETSMRDHQRGRIYRIVYKGATPAKKRSLSKADPAGLLEALTADNMFWRLHAQRLIVERGQKDIVPQLIALVRNQSVDSIGTNGGAFHALWTLHGLGELNTTTTAAYTAAVQALKHPAAGVRKAAAMVLPRTPEVSQALLPLLQDPDLHTRLAVALAIADMPTSPAVGRALYQASQQADNYSDRWLSRAIYIGASKHRQDFIAAYKGDRNALPYSGLPVSLRLGTMKPDWRLPAAADSSEWQDMQLPGAWETKGLPDFDGVVWFTRTFDLPAGATANNLSLGIIRNQGEVWMNGLSLSPTPFAPPPAAAAPAVGRGGGGRGGGPGGAAAAAPPAGGRGNASATYPLPPGVLRPGKNTITVRVQNNRNEGGFLGTPESMFVEAGDAKTPLAGTWKYRVERQSNAGALYTKPGQLAAHVAFTAEGGLAGSAGAALPPVAPQAPDVVLRLGVVPQQMKFDTAEFTVAPGQLVELVYTNPDVMQHNFVVGAPGTLTQIGEAGDRMAASPTGLAQQYVPDIPQIVFSTKLLEPGQTVTVQFKAPAAPGQYPFVCTFPAHWRTMNGILNVVIPAGRGGRGGL